MAEFRGSPGNDTLTGNGNDLLEGFGGTDSLSGAGGNATLSGFQSDFEQVEGSAHADTLTGGSGRPALRRWANISTSRSTAATSASLGRRSTTSRGRTC